MRRYLILLALLLAAPHAGVAAPPLWPQATSDLKPDPAVRFGVLPNGMRYVVMRNTTPLGQTSLRLRIGSGSLEESDDEQGLAHVLEHMNFKGSTHVPPGEMVKILQRKGLAFGPDTNAQTGWTQTVYMLDLPRSDPDTIDTGLMLFRETASELLILPDQLATERGVVLSEERLRDTPQYRAVKAQLDLLAHGQRITRRFPIGLVDVVENAPATLIRKFYRANYRPERATLVAVGDFDPAAMETKIRAMFSTWRDVGPSTPEPDLGTPEKRGLTVKVVELPGASTQSSIGWARPYDDSLDTAAKRRRDALEGLALAVLNRRLEALAQGGHPPFLQAFAVFENLIHSDKVAVTGAVSAPKDWPTALAALDHEVRQLVMYGVGQAELEREIVEARAPLANAVAGESTRQTPALATALAESVDEKEVFTDPKEELSLFDADVKGLTAAEVDAAARAIFAGSGPLVEVASPEPIAGSEDAVRQAYLRADAEPVTPPAVQAAVVWPYHDFGPAGAEVSRKAITDLGVTQIRFANGVALTVRPSTLHKDQVLVRVEVGGGRRDLSPTRVAPGWIVAAFVPGGLGKITFEDMNRALAAPIFGAQLGIGDDAFLLSGQTRPADILTQMQVLAAYVTDPGWRPDALERARAAYLASLPQLAATPEGVLGRDLASLLRSGDARWAFPTREVLESANIGDLKALLGEALAHERVEVTIVGDITTDEAATAVARTFGALPARSAAPGAVGGEPHFPAASEVKETDGGRPDQAIALIAWPGEGYLTDMHAARAAYLAGDVLQNRIVDKVRVAEGATYSPETAVDFSDAFPDYGYAFTSVETPPAKIAPFFADLSAIVADLKAQPPSADEMARAKNPRIAGIRRAQLTNEYWVARLSGSIGDPRRLDLIRSTIADYEALTAADVQAAARRWLVDDKAWKLIIEAPPAAAAP